MSRPGIRSVPVSIPSRGFWFFEALIIWVLRYRWWRVSIPSRGFWFFEVEACEWQYYGKNDGVSIPSRGFWFFEGSRGRRYLTWQGWEFQSPLGDFGFLKQHGCIPLHNRPDGLGFQSPLGDFGFLKYTITGPAVGWYEVSFNPLSGILVF